MKKKYQTPVTVYAAMDTMQMIAESLAVFKDNDDAVSATEALSRETDFWDEEN